MSSALTLDLLDRRRRALEAAQGPAPPAPRDRGPGASVNSAIRAAAGREPAPASPSAQPSPPAGPLDGGAREASMPRRPPSVNDTFNSWFRTAVEEVRGW